MLLHSLMRVSLHKSYSKTTKRDVELKCFLCIRLHMSQRRFSRSATARNGVISLVWHEHSVRLSWTYTVNCRFEPSVLCIHVTGCIFVLQYYSLYAVHHSNNALFSSKYQSSFQEGKHGKCWLWKSLSWENKLQFFKAVLVKAELPMQAVELFA